MSPPEFPSGTSEPISPFAKLSLSRKWQGARLAFVLGLTGLSVPPVDGAPSATTKKVPVRLVAESLYAATTPKGAMLSSEQVKPLILHQVYPASGIPARGYWPLKIGVYILDVRPDGTVSNVEILQSTGHRAADGETVRCLMKWRFRPNSVKQVRVPAAWTKSRF